MSLLLNIFVGVAMGIFICGIIYKFATRKHLKWPNGKYWKKK